MFQRRRSGPLEGPGEIGGEPLYEGRRAMLSYNVGMMLLDDAGSIAWCPVLACVCRNNHHQSCREIYTANTRQLPDCFAPFVRPSISSKPNQRLPASKRDRQSLPSSPKLCSTVQCVPPICPTQTRRQPYSVPITIDIPKSNPHRRIPFAACWLLPSAGRGLCPDTTS